MKKALQSVKENSVMELNLFKIYCTHLWNVITMQSSCIINECK
jgi:hypothetical protein